MEEAENTQDRHDSQTSSGFRMTRLGSRDPSRFGLVSSRLLHLTLPVHEPEISEIADMELCDEEEILPCRMAQDREVSSVQSETTSVSGVRRRLVCQGLGACHVTISRAPKQSVIARLASLHMAMEHLGDTPYFSIARGELSKNQAKLKYGIPQSTLAKRMKNISHKTSGLGRFKRVFDAAHEDELCKHAMLKCNVDFTD